MNFESHLENIKKTDPEMYDWILKEIDRQKYTLELIPSECITSPSVLEALGSVFTNKYSEGYPGKRYYGGNQFVDEIEKLTQERAKKIFEVEHVNVQPYSGSPANFAVYTAVCQPGDIIMGQALTDGGHLTHGSPASATSKYFKSVQYHVTEDGEVDMEEVERLAKENKPKLIWVGTSAYSKILDYKKFAEIADSVGAYLAADIAHIAGMVAGGSHPSPVNNVHIMTTTTHKTLRGPRGGMIMVTKKGLEKDEDLAKKIDSAIFPQLQGGPHNHQIAAIGVALAEAMKPDFRDYAKQIVKNAKALAQELISLGMKVIGGGTDTHLMLVDCGKGRGVFFQDALDVAGITLNKNTIPKDPSSPFYPSGVRLGTPIMTTRGMKEEEMKIVAGWLKRVFDQIAEFDLPEGKKERIAYLKDFQKKIEGNEELKKIREEVKELCQKFGIY